MTETSYILPGFPEVPTVIPGIVAYVVPRITKHTPRCHDCNGYCDFHLIISIPGRADVKVPYCERHKPVPGGEVDD